MAIFLVLATGDLRAGIAATCSEFYMPLQRLALVEFNGTREELLRQLKAVGRGERGIGDARGGFRPSRLPPREIKS